LSKNCPLEPPASKPPRKDKDNGKSQGYVESLNLPNYEATVERVILFQIEAWYWNCPQHIPIRYSESEVVALKARINELLH
jgi:predicted pyridoxine 5'-phosphate oxidase superfamily flavin-nucleotide-binding protein